MLDVCPTSVLRPLTLLNTNLIDRLNKLTTK